MNCNTENTMLCYDPPKSELRCPQLPHWGLWRASFPRLRRLCLLLYVLRKRIAC